MQEAYRPPCSKYSLCCPNWVPPQSWPGGGYLTWVPPWQGTPWQGPPSRVPPQQGTPRQGPPWQGTPQQGTPQQGTLPGWVLPPPAGPGRVLPPPMAASWHSGKCCKALWDMGTPPGVNKLTKWNYYLPIILCTWAVIIIYDYIWNLISVNEVNNH